MTAPAVIRPSSAAAWQQEVHALGSVVAGFEEIVQSIRIILLTVPGTVPLVPDFGCDLWRWIDKPIDVARTNIVVAITDAITRFEPRAQVKAVTVTPTTPDGSQILVRVSIVPAGGRDELVLALSLPDGVFTL